MSGFDDAAKAIEARLAAAWTVTPIRYENAPFKETTAPYIALYVLDGEGHQVSLQAAPLRRWVGIITIQIFVPQDTGTRVAKGYANTLGAIFDRAEFSSGASGLIRSRIPSIREIGILNGWYQVNVDVPFIRDKAY
jgi:hypothetical protein